MLLALRKYPPAGATLWQRFACWVIKARLVSQYCHGGVVVNERLLHTTATGGLHCVSPGNWSPENWDLFDVGGDDGEAAEQFIRYEGVDYDWFSLLAFVGPRVRDSHRFYCFEWCWLAMTGEHPKNLVTPEMLLSIKERKLRSAKQPLQEP